MKVEIKESGSTHDLRLSCSSFSVVAYAEEFTPDDLASLAYQDMAFKVVDGKLEIPMGCSMYRWYAVARAVIWFWDFGVRDIWVPGKTANGSWGVITVAEFIEDSKKMRCPPWWNEWLSVVRA